MYCHLILTATLGIILIPILQTRLGICQNSQRFQPRKSHAKPVLVITQLYNHHASGYIQDDWQHLVLCFSPDQLHLTGEHNLKQKTEALTV